MIYRGMIAVSASVEVDARDEQEAARIIFSRLADCSKGMTGCQFSVSGIERAGKSAALPPQEERKPDPAMGGGSKLKESYGTFGKFLRQFMFENALTRKDLASLLGVTPPAVTHWCERKNLPTVKHQEEIARRISDMSGNQYRATDILALFKEK